MSFYTICISVLCAVLVVLLTPFVIWYLNVYKNKKLSRVHGPTPYPIVGNSNLLGKTPSDLLKSLLNLQKAFGSVYKIWTGPYLRLVVIKPEFLDVLLASNVHTSKTTGYDLLKPWLGDGLLVSSGAKWKSRRKMITPAFHFKILDDFMQIFNCQTNVMLDEVAEHVKKNPGATTDIYSFINLMSLDIICETSFGTPINAQQNENRDYVEAVNTYLKIFVYRFFSGFMSSSIIFRFSEHYKAYKESLKTLRVFCDRVIQKRKTEFAREGKVMGEGEHGVKIRSGLLDLLLEANRDGGNLTDEDLSDEVNTFMFEGHDTSSTTMSFILYELAQNPQIQDRVYEEICDVLGKDPKKNITMSDINNLDYLDLVIKEVLRIYPTVPLIERKVAKDCLIDGITVPKDTAVIIFIYGMNHNPEVFPEPDRFDPDRFLPENSTGRHNYAYIPFGIGPRNCIGQKYALYEIKTCIAKFLLSFRVEKDIDFVIDVGTCAVLKAMNGYKMKIAPRI